MHKSRKITALVLYAAAALAAAAIAIAIIEGIARVWIASGLAAFVCLALVGLIVVTARRSTRPD